jgi:integrase-like protein
MRTHGLQGAYLRRGWKGGSTRQNPAHAAAPYLVERDFRAAAPNRLWVADLTRILTGEGVLWLASVRDAFANRIVGWATDPRATTTLVLTALNHTLRCRDVHAGQLIFHSDKGAQYTALRLPNASSTPGSPPRRAAPGTASTRWPRTSGPRSRSSSCTGPAPRSPPASRPSTPWSATSTGGTTPAASRPRSAGSHPTSTKISTIANSTTPTGNPHSGKRGNLISPRRV